MGFALIFRLFIETTKQFTQCVLFRKFPTLKILFLELHSILQGKIFVENCIRIVLKTEKSFENCENKKLTRTIKLITKHNN